MPLVRVISRVLAFAVAIAASLAFSPFFNADQIVSKGGFVVGTSCTAFNTIESNCDLEETNNGLRCHILVNGQQRDAGRTTSCATALWRDDD